LGEGMDVDGDDGALQFTFIAPTEGVSFWAHSTCRKSRYIPRGSIKSLCSLHMQNWAVGLFVAIRF
jgi:hypothetical protein